MVHHWKPLELEITELYYHHDPTHSGETVLTQTSSS